MILGIGIDSVNIKRFEPWHNYNHEELLKILSEHEIKYCLENPRKSAERFAARFAAREAFFKAFCQMTPEHNIPFLTICQLIWIKSAKGRPPQLNVNWQALSTFLNPTPKTWISITHTAAAATVIAILEHST